MDPGRITIVVAAAAVGVVVLILLGLIVAKLIETHRYKAQTRQATLINEINVRRRDHSITSPSHYDIPHLPPEAHRPRKLIRNSKTRKWSTVSSENKNVPEMTTISGGDIPDPLRSSMYTPPVQSNSNHRRSQSSKSAIRAPPKVRLSAITERTDCTPQKSPVSEKVPAQNASVEKWDDRPLTEHSTTQRYYFPDEEDDEASNRSHLQRDSKHQTSHGSRRIRSQSTGSIVSAAPASPLPPLPRMSPGKYTQRRSRASVGSVDTVSSSVILGNGLPKMSPKVDFRRQALSQSESEQWQHYHNAATTSWNTNSIQVYPDQSLNSRPSDGLQVVDASIWNQQFVQKPAPAHHSRWSKNSNDPTSVQPPSRGEALVSNVERHETDDSAYEAYIVERNIKRSSSVDKGHKRQNCIRITGLTPVLPNRWSGSPRRKSHISETIHEIAESPSPLQSSFPKGFQDADLQHQQLSPQTRIEQSLERMNTSKKNADHKNESKDLRKLRGGSTLFGIFQNECTMYDLEAGTDTSSNTTPRPLEAASPGSIRMNARPTRAEIMQSQVENAEALMLLDPSNNFLDFNKARNPPQGPRSQPPKAKSLRTKSMHSNGYRKTSQNDLRRSIITLKRINSDMQQQISKYSSSTNTNPSEQVKASATSLQDASRSAQTETITRKCSSKFIQSPSQLTRRISKRRRSRSTSTMLDPTNKGILQRYNSVRSNASMWEDESVHASPEPDPECQPLRPPDIVSPIRTLSPGIRLSLFAQSSETLCNSGSEYTPQPAMSDLDEGLSEDEYRASSSLRRQTQEQSDEHAKLGGGSQAGVGGVGLGLRLNDEPWEPGSYSMV